MFSHLFSSNSWLDKFVILTGYWTIGDWIEKPLRRACSSLATRFRAWKARRASAKKCSKCDTGGVPIHELDNVDTVKLQLDGIKAWRSR